MPPLKKPKSYDFIRLKPRKALLAAETDVLIVGGGPAGLGAAYGAAKAGAEVILAERYGFFGGNATAALVNPFMSFYTQKKISSKACQALPIYPRDHGEGFPAIGGVVKNFIERLVKAGGAIPPGGKTGFVVPFDHEIFKLSAIELLDELGVKYLLHSFASGITGIEDEKRDKGRQMQKTNGVVFETKSGPVAIEAQVIIDCTGDGDIAAAAGAPFDIGREQDGQCQPMTLYFRMGDFKKEIFEKYVEDHPGQWNGVCGLLDLIHEATEKGELDLPREDMLFFSTPHEKEVSINSTRVIDVLGTDVWDLTYAEWHSRKQLKQIVRFLKKYVPGFLHSYNVQSGVDIGVRETRRIIGDYTLTVEDILSLKRFDDRIALSTYPLDIHCPSGKGTEITRIPEGGAYGIPLRCLIPKKTSNMLTAGRCISGTHEAMASYRVMPVSMATGQASGVCAALAAKHSQTTRQVSYKDVQRVLIGQGAFLEVKNP